MHAEKRIESEREERKRQIESFIFRIKSNTNHFINAKTDEVQELVIIAILNSCDECLLKQLDSYKIQFLHRRNQRA